MTNDARAVEERFQQAGASDRTSAGRGKGFVKWEIPDTCVEGEITDLWSLNERDVITVAVNNLSALAYTKNHDGKRERVDVNPGDLVCVSMGTAQLTGTVRSEDKGSSVFIHYKGAEDTKSGNRVKLFMVKVLPVVTSPQEYEDLPETLDDHTSDNLPL